MKYPKLVLARWILTCCLFKMPSEGELAKISRWVEIDRLARKLKRLGEQMNALLNITSVKASERYVELCREWERTLEAQDKLLEKVWSERKR